MATKSRKAFTEMKSHDRHGAACSLSTVTSEGATLLCNKTFVFLIIVTISPWVFSKEPSSVCAQAMSSNKVQVLAPFGFAIFRAKPVEGVKIVDVLRLETWVKHLREGHLTNLITEQEALRHPRLYALYSAMEAAITTFSNYPVTELVPTGNEFLQKLKKQEQQKWQVMKETEQALTKEELDALELELIEAAKNNNVLKIKELLQKGANIETRNKDGGTALMEAAWWGKTDVAQALLAADANIEARDNLGRTALDIARWKNHQSMIEILEAAYSQLGAIRNFTI